MAAGILLEALVTVEVFALDLLSSNSEFGDEDWHLFLMLSAFFLPFGLVSVKKGADMYNRSRLVKNQATEKVRSVAVGRTELKGAARACEEVYPQPFKEGDCVFARWEIEERVTKEVPGEEDETKTEWETQKSGYLGDDIVLEDDTGAIILKDPPMKFSDEATAQITEGRLSNLFEDTFLTRWFDLKPNEPTQRFLEKQGMPITSDDRRRYTQKVIPPGTELYALGQVVPQEEDDVAEDLLLELEERHENFQENLMMEKDTGSGEYIVSDMSEDELARGKFYRTLILLAGGVLLFAVGAGLLGLAAQDYGLI